MPPTATITPEDVSAARSRVAELEASHEEALDRARSTLAERKASNGGTLPTTNEVMEQTAELFAAADGLGLNLDQARAHLNRLHEQAYGRDPQDRMPQGDREARGYVPPSLGARLLASDEFREASRRGSAAIRRLSNVELLSTAETAQMFGPSNPTVAATFNGDPLVPVDQRLMPPVDLPERPVRVLDLITIGSTDSDTVAYTEETTRTMAVGGQAAGALLGESTIVVTGREVAVRDRGTTLPVHERNLEDQGQLRTWLNGKLSRGVLREAEDQIIAGPGTGEDFEGILNRAGIGTYTRVTGVSRADALHKGITAVRVAYEDEPDAILYRPEDLETIMLERSAGDGHYVNSGGPFGALPQSVWGKRAVASTAIAVNTSIVGYWPEAVLWMRAGVQLREFEQHSDYAARRMVLLRALWRGAFKVLTPSAFCSVNLTDPL